MLTNRIAIYIPSTTAVNVKNEELSKFFENKALDVLATNFGGATVKYSVGAWKSEELGIVKEDIAIVEAYYASDTSSNRIAEVYKLAKEVKEAMSQEAVSIEHNGQLQFI